MEDLFQKLVYALVRALIDSGALTVLRQALQDKLIEPAKPNEQDETFLADAHTDGWK